MKKLLCMSVLSGIVLATNLFAENPDHIIITEFVVTPTAGEFIEVYNPTSDSIDLSHHYVTDEVFNNNNNYINVVKGGFSAFSSDFMVKFPDGTKIGPGQHMTIAVSGTGFTSEYSAAADFEILGDDAATPDMTAVSVGGSAGLSNAGEVIIVFYWDGISDLVKDVDIVVWGDQAEAVDKTGVKMDGIDADTDSSTYANDTPVADQFVVNADNDGDPEPHDFGHSAQRRLNVEDVENWSANGNGLTGHDETGENTSWLSGGIWSINEPATPGRRALTDKAPADSLTIADIQFLRADSVGTDANEDSPFLGDTLTVTGVVMNGIREINLGARWGAFIQDARGGPWSGFFVIQNDTGVTGTLLNAAQPGDLIRMTGVMEEFPTNPNTQSISEASLLTMPATPIEILQGGVPLPDPILLKPGDIAATGSSEDPRLTERLESTLVRFEGLTVMSNSPGQAGNLMTAGDGTGTIAIDDYFFVLRDLLDNQTNGEWPGFPVGTVVNVTGFMRDVQTGGVGRTTINPRSLDDIEIASAPPAISSNVTRDPVVVSTSDSPSISTVIQSATSTIASASLNYRVDGGAFQQVTMTNTDSLYSGSIPTQADGALIEYFISATDADGLSSTTPGDTASSLLFYFVRDAGLSVFDLQFTPFADGNSSYRGLEITVPGIVTSDSADFSFYFIQTGTDAWNGIWVQDNVTNVKLGDSVSVTGTVEERFNATRINNVTNVTIHSSGNTVPEPVVVPTGELAVASTGEQWEGMLVRVENVGVSNPFPDGASNFGEFSVDDGSGEVRVDDLGNFRGNLDTAFVANDSLISLTGIHHFTFGNYKIEPRNDNDVVRKPTSVETDNLIPLTFELSQNYPNPFNPETTIRYRVATQGQVTIHIYNILGQRVKTLVDAIQPAGAYTVQWKGTNDRGVPVSTGVYVYRMKAADFVQVKKMLFLK